MSDEKRRFRNALGWFTTGVVVITTKLEGREPLGITVNSFSSVSLEPPLLLWCLDKGSDTLPVFENCGHFTVNILHEDHQQTSNQLAKRGDHSLSGIEVQTGTTGVPFLGEALAHFECRVYARHEAGDHIIMIGEVVGFDYKEDGRPLLYHRGAYHALP